MYKAPFTSADITKSYTETHSKIPHSKQCRCRSSVARKNSIKRQEPRKKPREEPGFEGWPVFFWLCWVLGYRVQIVLQDVQTFIDDRQGQIIIGVFVEGATGHYLRSKCNLVFHSQAFRGRDSTCGRERERERVKNSRFGTR
jgi:hypothetical protein